MQNQRLKQQLRQALMQQALLQQQPIYHLGLLAAAPQSSMATKLGKIRIRRFIEEQNATSSSSIYGKVYNLITTESLYDKADDTTKKDARQLATTKIPTPECPPTSSHNSMEEIARKEKVRLEELLKSKGIRYGSYPRFTVDVK